MQLTRVVKKNLEFFMPLLPPGGMGEGNSGLGVIGDDGRPCAVLVAALSEEEIAVKWIYVHPDYRRKGIGCHLLRAAELYGRKKASAIRVSYPEGQEGCDRFFREEGYYVCRGDEILCVTLDEEAKNEEFRKLVEAKPKKEVVSLEKLPRKDRPIFAEFLRYHMGSREYLRDCTFQYSYCTRNEDGSFESCLLVKDMGEGSFQPVLLFNDGGAENPVELLRRFFRDLEREEHPFVFLQFVTPNASVIRFVERMAKNPEIIEHFQVRCAVKALVA